MLHRSIHRALSLSIIALLLANTPAPAANNAGTISTPCVRVHKSDVPIKWTCKRIKKGETLESLFGDHWEDVARFNRIDRRHAYPGVFIKAPDNLDEIRGFTPMPEVYEPASLEEKFILLDLSEEFLGAYEYGRLVLSMPAAIGEAGNETPKGEFRITAFHRYHVSSRYYIEKTEVPYPMRWGLRFYINPMGVSYWIHGRDVPGRPASHGCIGLYDEEMQNEYYGYPRDPVLTDAKRLYQWVLGDTPDNTRFNTLNNSPRLLVVDGLP